MNRMNVKFLTAFVTCWALGNSLGAQTSAYENAQFEPVSGLKPFEYMESPAPLPNYTPNASWGTQGEPITTMQKPLDPDESAKHMVTFPEFAIDLFVAEPEIVKPLWLAFDEMGRLWIAESVDYPNQLQPEGEGRDRLKIIEDTDGDGRADKFTIFADRLSIPTGFVFAQGGVIVVHSGKTELLRDLNGDDVADSREILFSGWGMNDTHATVSNLRYGFDNWIWGTVGYSGFNGVVGGKSIRFGQGIFRFRPDGSELEFMRSSNNNTWGLGLTEDNIIIGSTANGNASMYMPIPNRYYEKVLGWSAARLETIADSQNFYPITEKVRQVDWHGKYTAGSGSAIYTARQFPEDFWNRAQFVAEPTGHLLGLFFLNRNGADFSAKNARNFLASDDEWSSPIYGEVGPDGSLWVVDWYNYIIQHNPTPRGFENGKGNAYETPLRDKTHGRIYKVSHRGGKPSASVTLDPERPETLVMALRHDNLLWRLHAQRLMVERNNPDVIPGLLVLAGETKLDEIGLTPAAIHALWTLDGLGAFKGGNEVAYQTALGALDHPSAAVRRAATMVLPKNRTTLDTILEKATVSDLDGQVRLAGLLALSELPADKRAAKAILDALNDPANAGERWITDAATAAAATNDADFIRQILENSQASKTGELNDNLVAVLKRVAVHYAERGASDTVVTTLTRLQGAPTETAAIILDALTEGWPADKSPSLSGDDKKSLEGVMEALPESIRDRLLKLADRWQIPGLFEGRLDAILTTLRNQVDDGEASDEARAAAAGRWIGLSDTRAVSDSVLSHVSLLSSPTLSSSLIGALAESRNPETGAAILSKWQDFTPAVRRAAIAVLMRRSEWALSLLNSISEGSLDRTDIPTEYWSQLRQNPSRRVAGMARRLAEADASISEDRAEIVEKLLPLARQKGDVKRGKEVFAAYCSICHIVDGTGGKVGPELTGIGSRDREDILLEILDPNRSVEANYRLWNVTTKDGDVFAGRLDAETRTTVEILDIAAQKHVIQRKDIASMEASKLSIMPNGFEAIPADDLKALLEYLGNSH